MDNRHIAKQFKTEENEWANPINMEPDINTKS